MPSIADPTDTDPTGTDPTGTDQTGTDLPTSSPSTKTDRRSLPRETTAGRLQACRCAQVCDTLRGEETFLLDLREVTPIFDYFVLTTAASGRQRSAIAEEVRRAMRAEGVRPLGIEGEKDSDWLLQDYGDIILHVMNPEARRLYDLERFWADAERIDWRTELGLPAATAVAEPEDPFPIDIETDMDEVLADADGIDDIADAGPPDETPA